MQWKDIKVGLVYNTHMKDGNRKVVYKGSNENGHEYILVECSDLWEYPILLKEGFSRQNEWVEVKPKITKKVFFYIYRDYPLQIHTRDNSSQYYATPKSIETIHEEFKKTSGISWVSDIHEIVIDDPR